MDHLGLGANDASAPTSLEHGPRVLAMGVYPIARPRYGGPKRSRAVVEALRASFRNVAYVAVYPRSGSALAGPADVAVSPATQDRIAKYPYLADVVCGYAIYSDPKVKSRITRLITKFEPNVIVLEQLYPFLGLRPLLQELGLQPALAYNAQNVEHEMKSKMYESLASGSALAVDVLRRIKRAEEDLARESLLVAAVTEQDADALRAMGARRVILAPNGTSPLQPSRRSIQRHEGFLLSRRLRATLVFVSSAHQPNWRGFLDMVGTRVGFIPSDTRVLLCGGVSELARTRVAERDVENVTFWQRVIALGQLADEDLAASVLSARAVLLPVTQGGGSNLKTAEALASGRRIVATSFAFRGYEQFATYPGVAIADTPDAFRRAMLAAINEPIPERLPSEEKRIEQLYWPARLSPLVEGIADIGREAHVD